MGKSGATMNDKTKGERTMSDKTKKIVDAIVTLTIIIVMFVGMLLMILKVVEVEKLKKELQHQEEIIDILEDYYWLEKENAELENDIYWAEKLHALELENAVNNAELKKEIDELKDFIDNYEDVIGVYVKWLKENPDGTENEFETYLKDNYKWLYDWLVAQ